ncbi:MAG: substrate-binding domain-containing protein [Spirochaetia bacterium]
MGKSNSHKGIIGFFTPYIYFPNDLDIFSGINAYLRRRGYQAVCFSGGKLGDNRDFQAQSNLLYTLPDPALLAGLIVYTGSITEFSNSKKLKELLSNYCDIPMVSIASPLSGCTTIEIDNSSGVKSILEHLYKEHGYTNFAFICGPENHSEANERKSAYLKYLQSKGLEVNPDLLLPGDFYKRSGQKAARKLHDSNTMPQVIVAANDIMAIGAIEELKKLGYTVPYDVSVTGFDNQPEAILTQPSLTTVNQPWSFIGQKAADKLLHQINGDTNKKLIRIPPQLIVRQSCGCLSESVQEAVSDQKENESDQVTANNLDDRKIDPKNITERLLKQLQVSPTEHLHDHIIAAVKAFYDCLNNSVGVEQYLLTLDASLYAIYQQTRNTENLHSVATIFRNSVYPYVNSHEELREAENLFQQSRVLAGRTIRQIQANQAMQKEQTQEILNSMEQKLITTFSLTELLNTLLSWLPKLNISGLYLTLYENRSKPLELSRLMLFYRKHKKFPMPEDGLLFPSVRILPETIRDYFHKGNLILFPLYYRNEQLGTVIIDGVIEDAPVYYALHTQIASALKGVLAVEALEKTEEQLERKVKQRSVELEVIRAKIQKQAEQIQHYNEKLEDIVETRTQELVQTEKMASLGSLVAGLAHEINTPLGIAFTTTSYLNEQINELYRDYEGKTMKRSSLDKLLNLVDDSTNNVLVNLSKVSELIQSFKKLSIDQTTEEKRAFNLKDYLGYIIMSLKSKLKHTEHSIDITCDDQLTILSYPGLFSQIFSNLIMNSLIHGFHNKEKGHIQIQAELKDSECIITYSDDGSGMPQSICETIFDPFVTTRKGEGGTGLGMYIVYNIVTQNLAGTIRVKSEQEKGTEFIITVPVD